MARVKIYASSTCIHCKKAKEFLKQNAVDFEEIDVNTETGKNGLRELGFNVVPVLLIDGQLIRGFNEQAIRQAISIR